MNAYLSMFDEAVLEIAGLLAGDHEPPGELPPQRVQPPRDGSAVLGGPLYQSVLCHALRQEQAVRQ